MSQSNQSSDNGAKDGRSPTVGSGSNAETASDGPNAPSTSNAKQASDEPGVASGSNSKLISEDVNTVSGSNSKLPTNHPIDNNKEPPVRPTVTPLIKICATCGRPDFFCYNGCVTKKMKATTRTFYYSKDKLQTNNSPAVTDAKEEKSTADDPIVAATSNDKLSPISPVFAIENKGEASPGRFDLPSDNVKEVETNDDGPNGLNEGIKETRKSLGLDNVENIRWIMEHHLRTVDEPFEITIEEPFDNYVVRPKKNSRGRPGYKWNKKTSREKLPVVAEWSYITNSPIGPNLYRPTDDTSAILAWAKHNDDWMYPLAEAMEKINNIFRPYVEKMVDALDLITLPYSYNGEVLSRLKGCFFVMSRTSRLLQKPGLTNSQQSRIHTLLTRSFSTLENSIDALLVECRKALSATKKYRKIFNYYKRIFKGYDADYKLYLTDEDDLYNLHKHSTPYYSNQKPPVNPLVWEDVPTWEKTEFVNEGEKIDIFPRQGEELGERYYELTDQKHYLDFLWFRKNKCYIKDKNGSEYYNYGKFDDDLKITAMTMIHESARDIVVMSKRTFYEANKILTRQTEVTENDPFQRFILDDLFKTMAKGLKHLKWLRQRFSLYERVMKFQLAAQDFYGHKAHMNHLIELLSHTISWLSKHTELVQPLAYCLTDKDAKKVLLTKCVCLGYPLQWMTNFFCKNPWFQRVRFPMTSDEYVSFLEKLLPEWNDHVIVQTTFNELTMTDYGAQRRFFKFEFKKWRLIQPTMWLLDWAVDLERKPQPEPESPAKVGLWMNVLYEDYSDYPDFTSFGLPEVLPRYITEDWGPEKPKHPIHVLDAQLEPAAVEYNNSSDFSPDFPTPEILNNKYDPRRHLYNLQIYRKSL